MYVKIIASERWDVFETQCTKLFNAVRLLHYFYTYRRNKVFQNSQLLVQGGRRSIIREAAGSGAECLPQRRGLVNIPVMPELLPLVGRH